MPTTSVRPKTPAPPVKTSAPAADPVHDQNPGSAQLTAALLPAAAGIAFLAVLGMAWAQPDVPLVWAPAVFVVAMAALWALARADASGSRSRAAHLAAERQRLAEQLERVSDLTWELRESEERYRSLIDAQGDLVVRRDSAGLVTFLNPAFTDSFDIDPATSIGALLPFGPQNSATLGTDVMAQDVEMETRDGPRWFSWVDIRMRDDDGNLGPFYSVARDITARKQSEQALVEARRKAEATSQAKSRLLATVSHEFRTPLNGILGLNGLLRETGLSAEQQTYARGVQTSGEALLALVDDMLDSSKIEAGRLDLRPVSTRLEPLVQEIVELLAARAHPKNIDIAADVDPGIPAVEVDSPRLRQVLINLAGNGVKFTETGGVRISVSPGGQSGNEITLVFRVADTGPGIAPEEADRLFDEFEQGDSAISRRHGGAGLGLAISRRLVQQMGSDIVLTSTDAGGTTFEFALVLPVAAPAAIRDATSLAGRRILIIATEGVEPEVIARQVSMAGGEIRVVDNVYAAAGLVAAAQAAGHGYHAVLIDGRLTSGPTAALAELRRGAGFRLPAVVLIEPSRRGETGALRAEGFDAYLVRPVRRKSLEQIVGQVIGSTGSFHMDPSDIPQTRAPPISKLGTKLKVLLAEDNEINALLARAVLERLGHEVIVVSDGAAAVSTFRDHKGRFDGVLMDLHMPVLDGLAAIRAIRGCEKQAGLAPVYVLALTADVLAETRQAALEAGVNEVLQKPVTPESLRHALGKLVQEQVPATSADRSAV